MLVLEDSFRGLFRVSFGGYFSGSFRWLFLGDSFCGLVLGLVLDIRFRG